MPLKAKLLSECVFEYIYGFGIVSVDYCQELFDFFVWCVWHKRAVSYC